MELEKTLYLLMWKLLGIVFESKLLLDVVEEVLSALTKVFS